MKTRALKNYDSSVGVEVYDIDLNSNYEIMEFGKLVAEQCIVYVNQQIDTQRLSDIMTQWGQPSRSPIHNYILNGKLDGRHWREILLNLGYVNKETKEMAAVSMVSYKNDEKNRPKGLFANGELDWHSDQCAFDDAPRVIGLQSVSDTQNSQTQFLCTHDAYELLSADMKSTVKELVCKHKWTDGIMAPGLNQIQTLLIHYNMCPLDGQETRLYSESVTGLPGIKFPSHSFDGFVGMSRTESDRLLAELKQSIYQERYVYTQNWQDGEIVFMDQEITLHKRPTNVKDGDKRTMARVITYMDNLYPDRPLATHVRVDGKFYTHDEYAAMVDLDRKTTFEQVEKESYIGFQV
jgi:alpha-ketoglutarate-dependent taurine dioxygenase